MLALSFEVSLNGFLSVAVSSVYPQQPQWASVAVWANSGHCELVVAHGSHCRSFCIRCTQYSIKYSFIFSLRTTAAIILLVLLLFILVIAFVLFFSFFPSFGFRLRKPFCIFFPFVQLHWRHTCSVASMRHAPVAPQTEKITCKWPPKKTRERENKDRNTMAATRCIITRVFLWHENEHLKVAVATATARCIEFNTNSQQQHQNEHKNGNDAANVSRVCVCVCVCVVRLRRAAHFVLFANFMPQIPQELQQPQPAAE